MDEANKPFSNSQDTKLDNANDTKEKKCYVVIDFEAEMKSFGENNNKEISYRMPDGYTI